MSPLLWAAGAAAALLVWASRRSFAGALVSAARQDLGRGEDPPGSNSGAYVAELGAPWGLEPPFNYCSTAVARWLREAAESSGKASPIDGSPGSKATMRQLDEAGLWVDRRDFGGRMPAPGAILVWDKGTVDNPESGHIGVLERNTSAAPVTIEANHSSVVQRVERSWSDPSLLGVGLIGGWQ